jgi:hypothetical protein
MRCPVDETGMNSVMPSTSPKSRIVNQSIIMDRAPRWRKVIMTAGIKALDIRAADDA